MVILDNKGDHERAVKVEQQANSGLVFRALRFAPSALGLTPSGTFCCAFCQFLVVVTAPIILDSVCYKLSVSLTK